MRLAIAWTTLVAGAFFVDATYPGPKEAAFKSSAFFGTPSLSQWDLTEEPSINSTSQLIFSTASSFLQHWPNTRYRNGHSIVPGMIPIGTLLYHGTDKNETPMVPEWTATDPEHSYIFCDGLENGRDCWHLTLVVTRPLKVLYFDGSSAAKLVGGPMDSQDLVAWGEVKPNWTFNEKQRITDLCDWGKKFGIDGYLRMQMDFEIMLCDFSAAVKPVSFINLASANPDRSRPGSPPPDSPPTLSQISALFRVLEAGNWYNDFPGDPRVKLDYARLISFYDPVMFPSLQAARFGKERLEHRLDGISQADAKAFTVHLAEALKDDPQNSGTGVDWQSLIKVITNRFAERLEVLHYILNSTSTLMLETNATLKQAHRHITSMIMPYILHNSLPSTTGPQSPNYSWAESVFMLCATTHTVYLETEELLRELTPSERVLLRSVKEVTKEICRVLVGLWAEGIELGLGEPEPQNPQIAFSPRELEDQWKSRVESLIAWLDWSYWLRCRPDCGYEEMCYLPTWPFFHGWGPRQTPPKSHSLHDWIQAFLNNGGIFEDGLEEREWIDPQPRCIRRMEPLNFEYTPM
ncbi:hypothetical protein GALMADRAFT_244036 [Galerina marginata CBS 339.88]|uniref:Uncharacterized protein n=1 Tax=Galerina marginata (strain CBS 339.88) TaxID=685588 RepID=A0A067T636_GALM3|nr:hypothetical protein GALMADRAFT_244036 [Galerina marginata CBS 339.88]